MTAHAQRAVLLFVILLVPLVSACLPATPPPPLPSDDPAPVPEPMALENSEVPDLPFPDNPDPTLCGIPTR